MRRGVTSAIAVVVLLSSFLAVPAAAHVRLDWDPNDSASPLDLKYGFMYETKSHIVGGFVTYGRFRNVALGPKGDMYFDLDSYGDKKADYYLHLNFAVDSLRARVLKYTSKSAQVIGRGRAVRVSPKAVVFRFPRKAIRVTGGFLRWYSASRYYWKTGEYGRVYYRWDATGWKGHEF